MSWLPDSGWLRALDLRASTAAAVALAGWAVLGLADLDLLHLGALPTWLRAAFAVVAMLATALWLGRMWDLGYERWRVWRWERAVLAYLDGLSETEARMLYRQVEKNERALYADLGDPVAAGLRHRGLLELPLSVGDVFGCPHTIPDHVWVELCRRHATRSKND